MKPNKLKSKTTTTTGHISWLFLINCYQIMKNCYPSFVSNSPVYGATLHSEESSTTVLPLDIDLWLRPFYPPWGIATPKTNAANHNSESRSLQKALYTLLTLRASNSHTCAPPQTPPCVNKSEIWEMVWCGEERQAGTDSDFRVCRLSLHSWVPWGSKIKVRAYLFMF